MSRIWRASEDLGGAEVAKGVAGSVSPLLAGFSLAAIATIVTTKSDERPPLADEAVAALTVCAVLLLAAMQLGFQSLRYEISPAARLEWNPEATVSREHLDAVRQAHNEDAVLAVAYAERFRLLYNGALVAFLWGLSLLTFPESRHDPKIFAFVVSVAASVVQIVWMLRVRGLRRPSLHGFLPRRSQVKNLISPPSELEPWQLASVIAPDERQVAFDRADVQMGQPTNRRRNARDISIEIHLGRRRSS